MQPRRNRSRNIIWFNPPLRSNAETNVARKLLKLVKKHFSKHRYHKIFNKNKSELQLQGLYGKTSQKPQQ